MKKFIAILFAVLLLSVPAVAFDPYDDDPDEIERQNFTKRLIQNMQQIDRDEPQERSNDNYGAVIHGHSDSYGNSYSPSGSRNKVRDDGTVMKRVGNGYIDTDTGEIVPSND